MKQSGLRSLLLTLACLQCLTSQGYGYSTWRDWWKNLGNKWGNKPQEYEGGLNTIDEVMRKASLESGDNLINPTFFPHDTNMVRDEYDMIMPMEEFMEHKRQDRRNRDKRTISHKGTSKLWPGNTVYYEIQSGVFNTRDQTEIDRAIMEISHYTCVSFVEDNTATDRVRITAGSGGCYSSIGKLGGVQDVGLASGCRQKRIIIHELLHALGLYHEHNRPDRDSYLTVSLVPVATAERHNFDKTNWVYVDNHGLDYDYRSVMHYGKTAFSLWGLFTTLYTTDASYQDVIGTTPGLSLGDVRTINAMHSCTASCTLTEADCASVNGFVGKDCTCWCEGPSPAHPVEYCSQADIDANGSLDFQHECKDYDPNCDAWAAGGFCNDPGSAYIMHYDCEKACGRC